MSGFQNKSIDAKYNGSLAIKKGTAKESRINLTHTYDITLIVELIAGLWLTSEDTFHYKLICSHIRMYY